MNKQPLFFAIARTDDSLPWVLDPSALVKPWVELLEKPSVWLLVSMLLWYVVLISCVLAFFWH